MPAHARRDGRGAGAGAATPPQRVRRPRPQPKQYPSTSHYWLWSKPNKLAGPDTPPHPAGLTPRSAPPTHRLRPAGGRGPAGPDWPGGPEPAQLPGAAPGHRSDGGGGGTLWTIPLPARRILWCKPYRRRGPEPALPQRHLPGPVGRAYPRAREPRGPRLAPARASKPGHRTGPHSGPWAVRLHVVPALRNPGLQPWRGRGYANLPVPRDGAGSRTDEGPREPDTAKRRQAPAGPGPAVPPAAATHGAVLHAAPALTLPRLELHQEEYRTKETEHRVETARTPLATPQIPHAIL